jgi:predicted AAA+ superfamily ATPase
MTRLPASAIFEESALYTELKGALTENYVLCELLSLTRDAPFHWKSDNTAEVDFIAQLAGEIVPIEVKAAANVKARSLGIYRKAYAPKVSVRTSMLNLKREDGLINVPLYMLWTLKPLVKKCMT